MSDTPRTDAAIADDSGDSGYINKLAQHARQLERELASEKRWKCDHCGAKTIDGCPVCGAPQCCPQCCKVDRLQRELSEANQRIRELTECLESISKCDGAPDIDPAGECRFGLHCGLEDRCINDKYDHAAYEPELGVPIVLARLEDEIFEGLSVEDSKAWPEAFLTAIPPGADLSLVWPQFAHWLLVDVDHGVIKHATTDRTKKAIADVAALFMRWTTGEKPPRDEWFAARYAAAAAAYDAAAAAAYAYAAAAAYAYAAAADAACAAAYAADAADAYLKAKQASMKRQAEKLLALLAAAPVTPEEVCQHCLSSDCTCSYADVSPDMGDQ